MAKPNPRENGTATIKAARLKPNPRLSVLIPTFNRRRYLPQTIETVLAQTYQDFQIIIYDDGSTDNTEDYIAKITDPRVTYVKSETNRGVAYARNALLELCNTELGCWLDSDDLSNKYRFELLVRAVDKWDAPFVRSSFRHFHDGEEVPWGIAPEVLYSSRHASATGLFRRECAGQFDERIAFVREDVLWETEMVRDHGTGILLPFALYYVRRGKHGRLSAALRRKVKKERHLKSEQYFHWRFDKLEKLLWSRGINAKCRVERIPPMALNLPFELALSDPVLSPFFVKANEQTTRRYEG